MSTLKERNLKFETKQLHVGQESADPVTDSRAVPIYQTFLCVPQQRTCSCKIRTDRCR